MRAAHCVSAAGISPLRGASAWGLAATLVVAAAVPAAQVEMEPNNSNAERQTIDLGAGPYVTGKLDKVQTLGCEPDTYLVLFDKDDNRINQNDNDDCAGNGWGSGLQDVRHYTPPAAPVFGDNGSGLVSNGDGTLSLRIGVTGRPDGFDGNFNGLFQNGPHTQLGAFCVTVRFEDGAGNLLPSPLTLPDGTEIENPAVYCDEFRSGAEAFRINYRLPNTVVRADICVDNSVAIDTVCNDVDWLYLTGLVPYCDYCVTQVGGLDCECRPTDLLLGWFDKLPDLIYSADDGGPVPGYASLCLVADFNGRAIVVVTGSGDEDFDGEDDTHARAPQECPELPWGHGVCGCYTLFIHLDDYGHSSGGTSGDDPSPPQPGSSEMGSLMMAFAHGDLNMNGRTDTADLGILLGNFGWGSTGPGEEAGSDGDEIGQVRR